jgi:hypothetical protein
MSDTVVVSVLGGIGTAAAGLGVYFWRWLKQRRALNRKLNSYPPECKGVIQKFIDQNANTVILVPGTPPVTILERDGIIEKKASAGGYDAVAYYYTLRQDVFDIVTGQVKLQEMLEKKLKQ